MSSKIHYINKLYANVFFYNMMGSIGRKCMKFCVQSGYTYTCEYRKFRVAVRNSKQMTSKLLKLRNGPMFICNMGKKLLRVKMRKQQ